jgi:4-amino-4-deoxy-L-arabinose transferase-like glycosyltransferase
MRDLWAPDEPDFAQCVREMRERGSWLFPYLNDQIYDEKPILFFWLMKVTTIAGEYLTGGKGFSFHTAAWALRLPSVLAAICFAFAFQRWSARFLDATRAESASLILSTAPLWVWQAQMIQIDILFSTLLAWSWLSWLGGYLLLEGVVAPSGPLEARNWFRSSYLFLGLATLAKGPLGIVLSLLIIPAFLLWQRDRRIKMTLYLPWGVLLLGLIVAPWYLLTAVAGGEDYAFRMIVHQNLVRALRAWDHHQPWWKYGQYLIGDFWPWIALVPFLVPLLRKQSEGLAPTTRFFGIAFLLPLIFLTFLDSKQGKYLLMSHPFLALLLAEGFSSWIQAAPSGRVRAWAIVGLPLGLALPGLVLGSVAIFPELSARLGEGIVAFRAVLGVSSCILFTGAGISLAIGRRTKVVPVRATAVTLFVLYFVIGTWGFTLLDQVKNYRRWSVAVQPLISGHKVFFWQTIRSGAMVYTGTRMPELRSVAEIEARLGPGDLLVSQRREWEQDDWGMTPKYRAEFVTELSVPVGGSELLLLKKAIPPSASAPPAR